MDDACRPLPGLDPEHRGRQVLGRHDQDAAGAADERPPRHRRAERRLRPDRRRRDFTTSLGCTRQPAPRLRRRSGATTSRTLTRPPLFFGLHWPFPNQMVSFGSFQSTFLLLRFLKPNYPHSIKPLSFLMIMLFTRTAVFPLRSSLSQLLGNFTPSRTALIKCRL